MKESLDLFENICNLRYFTNTNIILFLNKSDLLTAKLARTPITKYFPECPNDYQGALRFWAGKFQGVSRNKSREIYVYQTNALDTKAMAKVISAVQDTIITNNLRDVNVV